MINDEFDTILSGVCTFFLFWNNILLKKKKKSPKNLSLYGKKINKIRAAQIICSAAIKSQN